MKKNNYSKYLLAIVAIIAIVGIVFTVNGGFSQKALFGEKGSSLITGMAVRGDTTGRASTAAEDTRDEEAREEELAREMEEAREEELAREMEEAREEELAREMEEAREEELAKEMEEAREEELAREMEEAREQELAREEEVACLDGYDKRESYTKNCKERPEGMVCIAYDDGFIWLAKGPIYDWSTDSNSQISIGGKYNYHHILNTNCVKKVEKEVTKGNCPTDYIEKESYTGNCKERPEGSVCMTYGDDFIWLEYGPVMDWSTDDNIQAAISTEYDYYHILYTNCVKKEEKEYSGKEFVEIEEDDECIDSDGGVNPEIFGEVKTNYLVAGEDSPTKDTCVSNIKVREMFCNDLNQGEPTLVACVSGDICKDGACVNDENEAYEEEAIEEIDCNGCITEQDSCAPFWTKLTVDEIAIYCDIDSEWKQQKELEESCQNNFECISNQCINGICEDVVKQLEEAQGFIDKLIALIKNIFGVDLGEEEVEAEEAVEEEILEEETQSEGFDLEIYAYGSMPKPLQKEEKVKLKALVRNNGDDINEDFQIEFQICKPGNLGDCSLVSSIEETSMLSGEEKTYEVDVDIPQDKIEYNPGVGKEQILITFLVDGDGQIEETNEENNYANMAPTFGDVEAEEVVAVEEFKCTETDGGDNPNIKGEATGYKTVYKNQIVTLEDSCVLEKDISSEAVYESSFLHEINCNTGNPVVVFHSLHECACVNGVCVEEVVADEEIQNINIKVDKISIGASNVFATICNTGDIGVNNFEIVYSFAGKENKLTYSPLIYPGVCKQIGSWKYGYMGVTSDAVNSNEITVEVDPNNLITETNENDNLLTIEPAAEEKTPIKKVDQLNKLAKPLQKVEDNNMETIMNNKLGYFDLEISEYDYSPKPLEKDQPVNLEVTVKNNGDSINQAFQVKFELCDIKPWSGQIDCTSMGIIEETSILMGEEKTYEMDINNIPKELIQYPLMSMFGAKESLAIKLIVSSNGQFEETDHSNNNVLYDADFS
jgi:hypothetical protein